MDEIKPKPCPFCGSTDVESCPLGERPDGKTHLVYYVACNNCGSNGPLIQTCRSVVPSPDAARSASIDLWNWRAVVDNGAED